MIDLYDIVSIAMTRLGKRQVPVSFVVSSLAFLVMGLCHLTLTTADPTELLGENAQQDSGNRGLRGHRDGAELGDEFGQKLTRKWQPFEGEQGEQDHLLEKADDKFVSLPISRASGRKAGRSSQHTSHRHTASVHKGANKHRADTVYRRRIYSDEDELYSQSKTASDYARKVQKWYDDEDRLLFTPKRDRYAKRKAKGNPAAERYNLKGRSHKRGRNKEEDSLYSNSPTARGQWKAWKHWYKVEDRRALRKALKYRRDARDVIWNRHMKEHKRFWRAQRKKKARKHTKGAHTKGSKQVKLDQESAK